MAGTKFYSGTLQKGSKGDSVKEWQTFLNSLGYGLSVDGDFGTNTYNATVDYQRKNGLSVDGIVGKNTWGKAGYLDINTPLSTPKAPNLAYTSYTDTEEGQAKNTALSDALKNYNNYGDHNWANEGVYQQWLNKKLNRDPFSYDLNADALYQQYKDKYIQQGQLAMEDTIGQASAMTGGYGNSYAATVGNQAYQAHLEELNDVIPELYNMALNKYNMDGQEIAENLALLDADYNKSLGEWQIGYGQLKDKLDVANSDFYNSADLYGSEQNSMNSIAQSNYENEWRQAEWDESMRRYELEKLSSGIIATGGGSGGGTGYKTKVDSNGNYVAELKNGTTVPTKIVDSVKNYTTKEGQADYLAKQVSEGKITTEEAYTLLDEYGVVPLTERSWAMVNDGGINWLWGIDNDAAVRDEFGNEYTLKELKKELQKTMTNAEAKKYIKELQEKLGI